MNKFLRTITLFIVVLVLGGCGNNVAGIAEEDALLKNGGFETGDLTGWEVIEGDAFNDDVVAKNETFWGDEIKFNHEGNWHLYGLGYDESIEESRTGKLKSSTFTLAGDGMISMKLGAGRDVERTYVAVHLAETDEVIAKQGNTEFVDPGEADIAFYEEGVAYTNNYVDYELDLSKHLGKEMYLVIVDENDDGSFGFINVDDIRTYYVDGVAQPQEPGEKPEQEKEGNGSDVVAPSDFKIANAGFEEGNLSGWTIEGDAFDDEGVTSDETWWDEEIPYNRDGDFHFGMYNEPGTGTLTSTTFELGGSGYVSFKLGGGSHTKTNYMSFVDAETDKEIARFGNTEFADVNFPNIDEGLRLANLVQYKADLADHIGKDLYIVINDQAIEDWGLLTFDSIETYHESIPEDGIKAINLLN